MLSKAELLKNYTTNQFVHSIHSLLQYEMSLKSGQLFTKALWDLSRLEALMIIAVFIWRLLLSLGSIAQVGSDQCLKALGHVFEGGSWPAVGVSAQHSQQRGFDSLWDCTVWQKQ